MDNQKRVFLADGVVETVSFNKYTPKPTEKYSKQQSQHDNK